MYCTGAGYHCLHSTQYRDDSSHPLLPQDTDRSWDPESGHPAVNIKPSLVTGGQPVISLASLTRLTSLLSH